MWRRRDGVIRIGGRCGHGARHRLCHRTVHIYRRRERGVHGRIADLDARVGRVRGNSGVTAHVVVAGKVGEVVQTRHTGTARPQRVQLHFKAVAGRLVDAISVDLDDALTYAWRQLHRCAWIEVEIHNSQLTRFHSVDQQVEEISVLWTEVDVIALFIETIEVGDHGVVVQVLCLQSWVWDICVLGRLVDDDDDVPLCSQAEVL